ncbi:beta-lactamase family protein, partial [Opitutaceae bacterium]|nr:beta-lactamase family protein [Opitutaceae bacterium]
MLLRSRVFLLILLLGVLVTHAEEPEFKAPSPAINRLVSAAESNSNIPGGSVRVVAGETVLFDKYFGTLDANSNTAWDDQTVVAIASISKSITATLTAILVGEGKLNFADPIDQYLPEYAQLKLTPSGDSVRSPSIAECLSHTSGLPGGTLSQLPRNSPVHQGDQADVARYLAEQGLVTEPGTKYAYSFRGFAVVSRVIEVVMDRPFAEVLQDKLLDPLGMSETTFTPDVAMSRRIPAYAARARGRSDEEVAALIKRFRARRGSF